MKIFIGLLLCLATSSSLCAQNQPIKGISLEECIAIALAQNNNIATASLENEAAKITQRQRANDLLPSLNGNFNLGLSRGRSIDPFTNDFVNEELRFSNAGLQLNATVFNGFRLINTWKQSKLNFRASALELAQARQATQVEVALAYLQVLTAKDVIELTQNSIKTSKAQLMRLKTLYDAGSGDLIAYSDLQGQLALDQTALVNVENDLKNAEMALNTLLNTTTPIRSDQLVLTVDVASQLPSIEAYLEAVLEELPGIKAGQLRLAAAKKGVAIARAAFVPQFDLFANVNTNYSSAARLFTETGSSIAPTGGFVTLDNQTINVFTERTQFEASEISFTDQLENNVSSSVGFAVRIPISNGFRAKNNVSLEKINRATAAVALRQTSLEMKQLLVNSHNSMVAAKKRYQFLKDQVAAFKESFRINSVRFENGVATSDQYIATKNNLDNAQLNLTMAKYEFELRKRILTIYANAISL